MTRPLRYQSDFLSSDADPLTPEQEVTPNPDVRVQAVVPVQCLHAAGQTSRSSGPTVGLMSHTFLL